MLFRNATLNDLDAIHTLAEHSGPGLTLTQDKALLESRIAWSALSFKHHATRNQHAYYLFVLEDPNTRKIVGTSAIEARLGSEIPFYSYKISKHTKICDMLTIRRDIETLDLSNDQHGKSELCTLYLNPAFRQQHNGLILSRARFLFIAAFPHLVDHNIIAEIRGFFDATGQSPFYEAVAGKFLQIPHAAADALSLANHKQFIADLLPSTPLPIPLLPKEVQMHIGKPHPLAEAAMQMLHYEGFRFNHYVDILDGGPNVEASQEHLYTLQHRELYRVEKLVKKITAPKSLLANLHIDFRATIAPIQRFENKKTCHLSEETARLLNIETNDTVQISEASYSNKVITP